MKKLVKFVGDHWKRIVVTGVLVVLSMHWGGFGDMGIIPGFIGIVLWTN